MKVKLISLNIELISYNEAKYKVLELAKNRISSFCCFANVHMTIEAFRNVGISTSINGADYIFSDGQPLTVALKWLYGIKQDRIAGMDFMPSILKASEQAGLSVFLYGGSSDVLEKLKIKITREFPDLLIAGAISPPYRLLTEQEENFFNQEINNTQANIVFVSLGCPKQELWMARHSSKIKAVLLGVGGAFPVYAELTKRAPDWMQKYSLEWLYRLIQEPQRMWKRYFVTNTLFVLLLFKELLLTKVRIKKIDS